LLITLRAGFSARTARLPRISLREEHRMKTNVLTLAAAFGFAALPLQLSAQVPEPAPVAPPPPPAPAVAVTWGGFVKFDVLFSQFSEGEVAQGTGRDFYVPSSIPVSAGTGDSYSVLDLHAKETRLFMKTEADFGEGIGKVGSYVEFDFISGVVGGSEVVTNAYNPALRRAYVTSGKWLLGQDWTTFLNLGSIPETLDFVAWPSEGTVFGRQPMMRYTAGNFAIALENRETTVLSNGGATVVATGDGVVPDLTARYAIKMGSGEIVVAGVLRQLAIDNAAAVNAGTPPVLAIPPIDENTVGGGVSVSGKVALGKDDIRFMVTTGEGIGRYVALGTSADAVVDANTELEAIGITAGFLAYRHMWTDQWRSSVVVSTFAADNDTALTGTGVTKSVQSVALNLLYSPVPKLLFGVELRHAEREVEAADTDGSLDRLQFSTKYSF
jgi:hypothetical protein